MDKRILGAIGGLAMLALGADGLAQPRPETPASPKESILHQQMHNYLDALVELQVKLLRREAEWAEYSKPLWAQSGPGQTSEAR